MAFCANCGTDVQGRFCAKCGTPVAVSGPTESSAAGAGAQPYSAPGQQTPPGASAYSAQGGQYAPPGQSQAGGLTDNMAGALAYALTIITGILFLVLAPYNQSKFVRFHAFQSIFFFAAWMAFWIIVTIVNIMMPSVLSILIGLLSIVVWLAGIVVWVLLMVKAYNNERFKLPIIGDLAEKQA